MRTPTQITLASELAIQCLSHTKIAAHLGHHRKTIRLWLKGIATDGLAGFLARHAQAKIGTATSPASSCDDQAADLGVTGS
ncbi:MAG: helix-turn-helix domain-containing protein [Nitrospira sp.]|nr:MAG: helix-turn-helix domain-containing protein [Nitrospira sp.]